MGHGSPKELVNGSLKELVKVHANAELEKWPKMSKESKWAKDAQEEINGTKKPTSNVIIYIYKGPK